MKKGYLIAIDLDGTLISGFDDYDKKSFELLKEISKDNFVVIATGRPLRSSRLYYELLELNTPIINYNGALVHNPNNLNFPKTNITINKDWVKQIINDNKDIISNAFCEIEDEIFWLKEEKEIESYLHKDGGVLNIGDFDDILKDDTNGAILFSTKGTESRLEKYINETFKGKLKIRFWHDEEIAVGEVYSPIITKGNGIKRIIDFYNLDKEKSIAIGDGHNDIELFEEVKIGVAMGNSHPELLNIATFITDDVKNNGVYNFLIKYFFDNKK